MNRDDVIRMAREAGFITSYGGRETASDELLERFAALVAAAEREASAKVCENMERNGDWITKVEAAFAIRARGQQ